MYKMFIVDDNPRDRRGVAGLLDWPVLGLQIEGQFASAMEALQMMERTTPDLVLTDVQMPLMDGIALGREIRRRYPSVKLMYMSSYDDFAYARSALQLEAEDYVLKPIRKAELEQAAAKAAAKLAEERSRQREREELRQHLQRTLPLHQDQFLRELLFGGFGSEDDAARRRRMERLELPAPAEDGCRVIVLELTGSGADPELPGYLPLLHHLEGQSGKPAGDERDKRRGEPAEGERREAAPGPSAPFMHLVPVSDSRLACLVDGNAAASEEAFARIMAAEEAIEHTWRVHLSVGVSGTGDLAGLPRLYRQAVRALETKVFTDRFPRMMLYEEIGDADGGGELALADPERLRRDIREALYAKGEPDAAALLAPSLAAAGRPLADRDAKGLLLLLSNALQMAYLEAGRSAGGFLNACLGAWRELERASEVADVLRLAAGLIALARDELLGGEKPYYDKVAQDIKDLIARRYAEPVTIPEIADAVYLSLTHANNIFKSKTNQTIFDYLTEYRMEKAKSLLRDPASRIYQVARQVGYANKSHFCLMFKKYTGLAPSEFKNRID